MGLRECSRNLYLRPSVLGIIRYTLHVPSLAWFPFSPFPCLSSLVCVPFGDRSCISCVFAAICQCVTCPLLSFHKVFSRAETFDFTQSAGLPFCALPFCIVCEDLKLMPSLCSSFFCICETVGAENRSQENLKRIWCKVSSFHRHSCHPLRVSIHRSCTLLEALWEVWLHFSLDFCPVVD